MTVLTCLLYTSDLEDEVQKLTDKYIKDIEAAVDKKAKEILTV